MAIAADFRVIDHVAGKLASGEAHTFKLDIPANVIRGGGQPKSVMLVKYFLEGASALTWELLLNGTRLLESSGSGSHLLMTMEAFDSNLLLAGENQIEIKVTHGLGTLRIGDTMVNFHVNI